MNLFLSPLQRSFVRRVLASLSLVMLLCSPFSPAVSSASAATGINRQISYQAKLFDATGTPVADGAYQVKLSIYDSVSAGTRLWTATGTTATPLALSVNVVNGLFTVYLGDTSVAGGSQNALDDTILWNSDSLYLGVTVGVDSEMSPRKRLTATPYAFNAERLQGMYASSSAFGASNVFALNQTSNTAATGTRSTLEVRSQGTSNANDFLIRAINDVNTPVFVVNRQGSVTTTGNVVVGGDLTATNATTSWLGFTTASGTTLNTLSLTAASVNLLGGTAIFSAATSTQFIFTSATGTSLSLTTLTATNGVITNATSTNSTSTNEAITNASITNLRATNGTTTNSTSTNLFVSNLMGTSASLTSLLVSGQSVCLANGTNCLPTAPSSSTLQDVTNQGNTTTNAIQFAGGTSTGLFTTDRLTVTTTAIIASLTATNGTTTNSTSTNLFATNLNVTNATSGWLGFTTASGTTLNTLSLTAASVNLLGGTAIFSSSTSTQFIFTNATGTTLGLATLTATNGTITNVTSTNATSTNAAITNLTATNGTTTNSTSSNLFVSNLMGTSASLTSLLVSGQAVCLANGTNCPSGSTTPTLQQVTTQGNTTTNAIVFNGGTSTGLFVTGSLDVTSTAIIASLIATNGTTTNASSTNFFATNVAATNATSGWLGFTTASGTTLNTLSLTAATVTILGGTINNTTIGATTASTARFTFVTSTAVTTTNLAVSGQTNLGSTSYVNGVLICLADGTNCQASTGDSVWFDNSVSGLIRPVTTSRSVVMGATATSTGAPVYFENRASVGTSTLFVGFGTSTNLVVGTTTQSINGLHSAFTLDGNDAYVEGNIGAASSIYTNGAFVAGTGTTLFADGLITKTNGDLSLAISGGFLLPTVDMGISLGSNALRFNGLFGSVTSTNTTSTNLASTNILVTNLNGTNATVTNQVHSNATSTNLFTTNFAATNATTSFLASVSATFTNLLVSGKLACLADGTNCLIGSLNDSVTVPPKLTQQSSTSSGFVPSQTVIRGDYMYVTESGNTRLAIYDISNPAVPKRVFFSSSGFSARAIDVVGDLLLLAQDYQFSVIDVSNPRQPVVLGGINFGDVLGNTRLVSQGNFVYVVGSGSGNFHVFNIADPRRPVEMGSVTLAGTLGGGLDTDGRYAYHQIGNTFEIVDVRNPALPVSVYSTTTGPAFVDARDVAVQGGYAYIAFSNASTVRILDVTSSTNPLFVSDINTGAGNTITTDYPLEVAGKFVFVGHANGVAVYDVNDPLNPTLATSTVLANAHGLSVSGRTLSAINGTDNTIRLYDIGGAEVAGLTAHSAGIGNLTVRDRATVNADLAVRGGVTVGDGGLYSQGAVNVGGTGTTSTFAGNVSVSSSLMVNGKLVCLADGTNCTGGGGSQTLDQVLTQGNTTTQRMQFGGGTSTGLLTTHSLNVTSSAILAAFTATNGTSTNFFATNASSTNLIALNLTSNNVNILGGNATLTRAIVTGLTATNATMTQIFSGFASSSAFTTLYTTTTVFGPYSPVLANDVLIMPSSGGSLKFYNVSNPQLPSLISTYATGLSVPVHGFVSGDFLYLADGGDFGYKIINIENPAVPITFSTSYASGGQPTGSWVAGKYAYLIDNGGDLDIFDVSDPSSPVLMSATTPAPGFGARAISVRGRYAYIASYSGVVNGQLTVVDVNNPASPLVVATLTLDEGTTDIEIAGNYAYLVNDFDETVSVVNIADSASPVLVSTIVLGGGANKADIMGRYLLVARRVLGDVAVYDVQNPASPVLVGLKTTGLGPNGIVTQGKRMYVVDSTDSTLSIIDMGGLETNALLAHSAEVGNLTVKQDAQFDNAVSIGGSLNVGQGGINSSGAVVAGSAAVYGLTWVNATGVNTTATKLFATNLNATNATATSVTSTGWLGFATASGTTLTALNLNATALSFLNGTSTEWFGFATASGTNLNALGLTAFNATATNVTSSFLFADTASSTNLFATNATTGYSFTEFASSTNLFSTAATTGYSFAEFASSTNLFSTNGYFGNVTTSFFFADTASSTFLFSTNATTGYLFAEIASSTQLFSTNATTGYSFAEFASSTNLFSTFGQFSDVTSTNWLGFETASGTSMNSLSLTVANAVLVNATSTFFFGDTVSSTNLFSTNATTGYSFAEVASSTQLFSTAATTGYSFAEFASSTSLSAQYATFSLLMVGDSTATGTADYSAVISYDGTTKTGLCLDNSATAETCPAGGGGFSIQADDTINVTPFDLAERYKATGSVTSSDLLILDTATTNTVRQSVGVPYDSRLVGIASTKPGLLLGTGGNTSVALSGRVPTKVSAVNGAIAVGDALTSSPFAGYAMKATKPGMVVGYALETASATSTIEVFVKVGYSAGSLLATNASGTESWMTGNLVVAATSTANASSTSVDSWGLTFRGSAWDSVSSTVLAPQFSFLTDVINATTSQFSIFNTTGTKVFAIDQMGDLSIAGKLFPGTRTGMQSDHYIFTDDSTPSSTYMATNADGWQANDSYDFAERYYSPEPLEAGELVVASRSGRFHVQKASSQHELLMGIVSTKPGFVTGRATTNTYPIALAGRVPTKVSTIKGVIRIGDPLGPSTIPGVAVKVTENGPIVGYSLEDYNELAIGDVEVFVNPGWFGGVTSTPTVIATTTTVEQTIIQQTTSTASSLRHGYATVLAGAKKVQVNFTTINSYPNISVTPYGETGSWWLSEVTDRGFIINLSQALDRDTRFAWKVEATMEDAQEILSDGTSVEVNAMTGQSVGDRVTSSTQETVTTTQEVVTSTESVMATSTEEMVIETNTTTQATTTGM